MNAVLDASAVLAFLGGEPGADEVEAALELGACCGAVNWSEVAQKVQSAGGDWSVAAGLLASYGVVIEPATVDDAERCAALWRRGSGLSLADRFCLALGDRLDLPVLTADTAWGSAGRVRQIR